MTELDSRRSRTRQRMGLFASLIGVAHFVAPQVFDPINRLGFPNHARTFTYINGGIETALGLLTAHPRSERLSAVVSACYVTYLTTAIVLTRARASRQRRIA